MKSFADELDFWHFEDDFMVFKDGSLGAGFELSGFDLTSATDAQINQMVQHLKNLFIDSEKGHRFQVFYKLTSNVEELINRHEAFSKNKGGPYEKIRQARVDFYRENQREKRYFMPYIYFFVRSQPIKVKSQGFFLRKRKFDFILEEEFRKRKSKFLRFAKQVESHLFSAGLKPLKLSARNWFKLIFEYLNFDRTERIGIAKYKAPKSLLDPSISEQLTLSDLNWDKDGIFIGNYIFCTISLETLPEGQTFATMVNAFSSVPFHFWLSQSIYTLNQSGEKSALEIKRRIAHSMTVGSKNVTDLDSESKLGQIEGLLSGLIDGCEKLVSSSFNVIIWGKSKEELDDKTDEILKTFRLLNQAEGLLETLAGKDAFLKAIPGACEGLRHKKMKSSNATHLMPIFSNWKGNPNPVCLLPTRDGELFSLDPYADHLPSWNGIVFGSSGSGKSFCVLQLMAMFYGKIGNFGQKGSASKYGPRIVWIDNGASSKRLVEVLDGEFIDMNLGSFFCLNVFDLKSGETSPDSERICTILAVLEMILKDSKESPLGKHEKALLEEQIHKVYRESKKDQTPTLSDFKGLLDHHSNPVMKKFGEILYSWTGSSAYGQMLDGQTNVKLSKDLVSIELQNLNKFQDLKDVLLLILTSYIQNVASTDIKREYLLIIDEAERLFQSELARQVVITCYRTWRKFKSGIWCLSQNYKDFMCDRSLKDALMTNTNSVIILRQRKIDWRDFQDTFDFTDVQVERIKSLSIRKGEYSEFYYLQDEKDAILRLIPEPLSHWFSTSDANDKALIEGMKEKYPHLSLLERLEKLAFKK